MLHKISLAPLSHGILLTAQKKHRQVIPSVGFLRDLLSKQHSQPDPFFAQLPSQSRRIESPGPLMGVPWKLKAWKLFWQNDIPWFRHQMVLPEWQVKLLWTLRLTNTFNLDTLEALWFKMSMTLQHDQPFSSRISRVFIAALLHQSCLDHSATQLCTNPILNWKSLLHILLKVIHWHFLRPVPFAQSYGSDSPTHWTAGGPTYVHGSASQWPN